MGPHISAVQYELDGIVHGLMANPDRKFVYCEMVLSDKYKECWIGSAIAAVLI